MKKITLITICLVGLFVATLSADDSITKEDFLPKKATTVVNEDVLFVQDSLYTDYPDGAYERTYHYYNDKGKMNLTNAHWWDADGNIEGGVKYVRDYDANNNETLHATYNWNVNTSNWTTNHKTEKEYDSNSNAIVEISAFAEGTDGWLYNRKNEMAYDTNNRMTSDTIYMWDNSASEWIKSTNNRYYYLGDTDKKTTESYFDWNAETGKWVSNYRNAYTFDDNQNCTLLRMSFFTGSSWLTTMSIAYSEYDQYGNYGLVKESYLNDDTGEMDEWFRLKFEYDYDERGNMLRMDEIHWNYGTEEWDNKYRFDYTYDRFDNMTSYARYDWSSSLKEWIGSFKFDYVYSDDNLWVDFFAYSWNAGVWEHGRRSKITYDENRCIETETECFWVNEEWKETLWNHYYWSAFSPVSIKPAIKEPIKVFSGDRNIVVANNLKGEDIRVYDLRGRLHNMVNNPADRHAVPAQTGVYIVRVGNYAAKVIVR